MEHLINFIEPFKDSKYRNHFIVAFLFFSLFIGHEIRTNNVLTDYLEQKNNSLKAYDESIKLIDGELEIIRNSYNADWAAISMFHNGEILLNGLHMRKFSRIYEARRTLKIDKRSLVRAVGFEPFVDLYENMILNGYIYFKNKEELKNPFYKQYIFQTHRPQIQLKSIIYLPIVVNGRAFGFFSLEFQNKKILNKKEIEGLQKYCVILGQLLTQKKKRKWYQIM